MRSLVVVLGLAGCAAGIDPSPPPRDWPALFVTVYTVSQQEVIARCAGTISQTSRLLGAYPIACAWVHFGRNECEIFVQPGASAEVLEHERAHCRGHDHLGERKLRDAWERHRTAR